MARMAPPDSKGPDMVIAIGAKPKESSNGRMKPPGTPDDPQGGGKATDEEAGAVMESDHCKNCKNWHADTGECDKVEGVWSPDDACVKYFEPVGGGEPDADEQGGTSDYDADDQPGGPPA